ncbi:MAG: VOC family protein [Chloroflexota bacterium]|nr:VOC family protein [Dehalococcoidia bacterium]MDE2901002.1 VOC family protein [Chloroflexota bacterium]
MQKTEIQIKTTGIDHVVLWVTDLERAKRFYIDLLGMTVAHESDWQSFLWCGSEQVALFRVREGMETKGGIELNHMALRMEPESYEATKARLENAGVHVHGRPGDDTCIYFDDPDGHGLQLLYKGYDG